MDQALIVISHYNEWPIDQLVSLLDQIHQIPAGHPFRCLIVVNRAVDRPFALPNKYNHIEVLERENTGYNIGAWDYGWRNSAPAACYLFLQEECRVLQPNWLRAHVRLASRPRVGLVGESLVFSGYSWERIEYHLRGRPCEGNSLNGSSTSLYSAIRQFLEAKNIPMDAGGEHLQSLIICTRREILEEINGFMIGSNKCEAISCEVAMSRMVVSRGYTIRQVGLLPFKFIEHPQWVGVNRGMSKLLRDWVYRYAPTPVLEGLRKSSFRLNS